MSFSAKLIRKMKGVIQCKINLENQMSHSERNYLGKMECVFQREIDWGNETSHSVPN